MTHEFTNIVGGSLLVAHFLRHEAEVRVRAPATLRAYASDLRHFVSHLRGEIGYRVASDAPVDALLLAVDRQAVGDYFAYCSVQRYRASTIRRRLSSLRRFYDRAKLDKRITSNPTYGIRHPGGVASPVFPVVLTLDDVERLRGVLTTPDLPTRRSRAIIEIALAGGSKRDELLAMRAADVDLFAGRVRIGSRRRSRWVLLDSAATHEVQRYLSTRIAATDALWVNQKGQPIDPRSLNRFLEQARLHARVQKPVNLRTLRNTHIARRLAHGEAAKAIVADLGMIQGGAMHLLYGQATRGSAA